MPHVAFELGFDLGDLFLEGRLGVVLGLLEFVGEFLLIRLGLLEIRFGLVGHLGQRAVHRPMLANVDEAVVAGQRIERVEHEGYVLEPPLDLGLVFGAAGPQLKEGRVQAIDVGHQHHLDVAGGVLERLGGRLARGLRGSLARARLVGSGGSRFFASRFFAAGIGGGIGGGIGRRLFRRRLFGRSLTGRIVGGLVVTGFLVAGFSRVGIGSLVEHQALGLELATDAGGQDIGLVRRMLQQRQIRIHLRLAHEIPLHDLAGRHNPRVSP